MVSSKELDKSFALLDAIFEMGCNTFDSAHIYGGGDVERTFGRWVDERGIRDKVVMIGKGAHHNLDRRRVTPFDIAADLHDSLARFKFDYIDIYLLHRDDPGVPVGPIVEALNEHLQAGRIRAFGGSNWSFERVRQANDYARTNGLVPFAASSPQFSLAVMVKEPWPECVSITGDDQQAARDRYAAGNMPLFTWSSLAAGFFSGRITRDNAASITEGYEKLAVDCYAREDNFARLDRAQQLAKEKGLTASQIALAWVLNQPMNIFPLVGCRTAEEFAENADALEVKLTAEEMAWLNLERGST